MYALSGSKERMNIVVLILFLVFFVDPLLPEKIIEAFQGFFRSQQAKKD